MRDRYLTWIDQLVEKILKGQLPSKEQVYRQLDRELEPETGDIFEQCLQERLAELQTKLDTATDELKQAKATRSLRALKTLQGEWERHKKEKGTANAIATAAQALLSAEPDQRFAAWVTVLDANQVQPLTLEQLKQLAATLSQTVSIAGTANPALQQLIVGIRTGIASWRTLEPHLVSWMYEQGQNLGFEGIPGQRGPWQFWSQQVSSPLVRSLFQGLALNQPMAESIGRQENTLQDWVDLALTLQLTQRGLVNWFEQQPYDSKWGTQQAIATFLSFAVLWGQLSAGITQSSSISECISSEGLSQGCFQMALQTLRSFTQKTYFPMYGGVFALLSGRHLQDALNYLDAPLRQSKGTQEKARMLTLLGYSQRALGEVEQALAFHQQALEIAQSAADTPCEIANLNHISRTHLAQKRYSEAVGYSQRALILARQRGDRLGEANALTNLGYAQILTAQQIERLIPEASEASIGYLKEGLRLSEQLGDRQSQALCYNSLGIAYGLLEQPAEAIPYLQQGLQAAQRSGDLYLQGLNWSYLAENYYRTGDRLQAIQAAMLGLYGLEQIQAPEQSQPQGLLAVLRGQLGVESFQEAVWQCRPNLLPLIGVDGFDHVLQLLDASSLNG